MKCYATVIGSRLSRILLILFFLFAFNAGEIFGIPGESRLYFNPEYKLKSYSGVVTVYTFTEQGAKIEYTFDEFNADILLLVYRKTDLAQIVNRLTNKYKLSQKDCRREVKMSINRLEIWDIIVRD